MIRGISSTTASSTITCLPSFYTHPSSRDLHLHKDGCFMVPGPLNGSTGSPRPDVPAPSRERQNQPFLHTGRDAIGYLCNLPPPPLGSSEISHGRRPSKAIIPADSLSRSFLQNMNQNSPVDNLSPFLPPLVPTPISPNIHLISWLSLRS